MLPSRRWSNLTTAEFADLDMEKVVAILPVAAVEQHGPHLPVAVDALINAGIVEQALVFLPDDTQVLVLPALPIGKSNEHLAFPGTLSISYETLGKVWFDVAESVHRAGCRRIIFFNSHGGQPQLVDIVCRELRVRLDMLAVACTWFQTIDMKDLFDVCERLHGIHGGAIETSVMLHLHPDLVKMDLAEDFVSASVAIHEDYAVLRSEGSTGFGWQAQDLHPSGVSGNATASTAEFGRTLVDRAARALAALIEETARYPLSNLGSTTRYSKADTSK